MMRDPSPLADVASSGVESLRVLAGQGVVSVVGLVAVASLLVLAAGVILSGVRDEL